MLGKIITTISILSGVLLWLLVSYTTPTSAGPVGVLVFFFLIYLMFLGIFTGLLRLVSHILSQTTKKRVLRKPIQTLSVKKSYYLSSVLSLAPVLVLAIQSFGGVGFSEFSLIVLFVIIGCVAVVKR